MLEFLIDNIYLSSSNDPKDNDVILSIVKVLIAKHLDASNTLSYDILLKE
jgi:hypothetical protein